MLFRSGRSGESGGGRKSGKRCESCHRKKTCPVYAEKRLYRIYDQRRGRYADKRGDPQQKDAGSDCQSRKNQGMGSGSCYIDSPEQLSKEDIQGAQVFYYKESEEGKKLAETIQDLLRSGLDPGNKRVAKSDMSYFMLKESKQPIVIVECGFLSNPQEEKKLSEEKYQDTIVRCVAEGVENFLYKW